MPPKSAKGREEAKEVAAFVRELYATSGYSSWGEFARSVGVAPATMSDWQRAENAPSGFHLLRLIRAARWEAAGPTPERLESVEEKVDAALVGLADILDLLRAAPGVSGSAAPEGSRK